jgi:integrase
MAKKTKGKYRDRCVEIDGKLYGVHYYKNEKGEQKKKLKRAANRTEARQWAEAQLVKLQETGGVLKIEKKTTFAELATWYKTAHLVEAVFEKGIKVDGVKDWKRLRGKLDRMVEYFGSKPLSEITTPVLVTYARWRRETDNVTTATINRDFALIRSAFLAGKGLHRLLEIPKFPINNAAEVSRERVLSFEEEELLLSVCVDKEVITVERLGQTYSQEIQAKRAHLKNIIVVAVDTAMRKGEIFKMDWSDVDLGKGIITIPVSNSKTQRERAVPMTPRVREIFEAMPRRKGKVFDGTGCKRTFATACERVGLVDENEIHFHDLRHTGTTRMVRAGVPHTEVMKITGHSQMKTFLRYVNLTAPAIQNAGRLLGNYVESQMAEAADSEAVN